ncbi:unnamed protein product [Gemmataceae bacterium]|nr:unnamed protein product [Gemmataceae bacterium]VTT99010.1 unnamed protein product [Gemmataceae bacterium]
MSLILEHFVGDGWQRIGTIGLEAGCRMLSRIKHPQWWRLRGDGHVWKVAACNGRVARWRDPSPPKRATRGVSSKTLKTSP